MQRTRIQKRRDERIREYERERERERDRERESCLSRKIRPQRGERQNNKYL